jgi:Fe-S cluster assembly protein SufD
MGGKDTAAEKILDAISSSRKKAVYAVEPGKGKDLRIELTDMNGQEAVLFRLGKNSRSSIFVKSSRKKNYSEMRGIVLEAGAEAEVCFLQSDGKNVASELKIVAKLGEGASLRLLTSNLGGKEAKSEISILQEGRGSRCEHYEISLAKDSQKFSKDSNHFHFAPDTYSRSVFKYATAGESKVDVEGKVTIGKNAPGADTHLLAKSLLLSDKASSKVVPKLFVHNADVAAGHGSALTPLAEEELFYLKARGICESESRLLVLQGFLHDLLAKSEMDNELVKQLGAELDAAALAVFPRD